MGKLFDQFQTLQFCLTLSAGFSGRLNCNLFTTKLIWTRILWNEQNQTRNTVCVSVHIHQSFFCEWIKYFINSFEEFWNLWCVLRLFFSVVEFKINYMILQYMLYLHYL